jgi:predicted hydrolase (HD superfamily)
VLAHAHQQDRTDLMSRAVVHTDAIAGLLVALALLRPERLAA